MTRKSLNFASKMPDYKKRLNRLKSDPKYFLNLVKHIYKKDSLFQDLKIDLNKFKTINDLENSIITSKQYNTYNDHISTYLNVYPVLNAFYSSNYNLSQKFTNYISKQKSYEK